MQTIEERYIDKSKWPKGPWNDEPDKLQFTDQTTGLPCLIVRSPHSGGLCGYVGVAEGHQFFEVDYGSCTHTPKCENSWCDHSAISSIEVHGGLTFSGKCQEGGKICNNVDPGENDNVWWLGFDCAHYCDFIPGYTPLSIFGNEGRVYRNIEYVKNEIKDLARQLAQNFHIQQACSRGESVGVVND